MDEKDKMKVKPCITGLTQAYMEMVSLIEKKIKKRFLLIMKVFC